MWKHFLKTMSIISLPLAIWPCGIVWCNDAAGAAAQIILQAIVPALLDGSSGSWRNIPDWRGRQIEELVSYWGIPRRIGLCPEGYTRPQVFPYFLTAHDGCQNYKGEDYKDAVKIYGWTTYWSPNAPKPCYISFMVNDKGKIIEQNEDGECHLDPNMLYVLSPPTATKKNSPTEEPKKSK